MRMSLKGIALLVGIVALAACEEAVIPDDELSRADLNGRWVVEEYVVRLPDQPSVDLAFQSYITMTISLDASDRERGRIDTSYSPPVNGVIRQREQIYSLTNGSFELSAIAVDIVPEYDHLEQELIGEKSRVTYRLIDKDTLHMQVHWSLFVGEGFVGSTHSLTDYIKAKRL